jgi:hypothetical protein
MRIVDLVEGQHQIPAGFGRTGLAQVQSRQRRYRQGEALVHRARADQAVDRRALDCCHLDAGTLGMGPKACERLGGGEQAMAAAPRIGERRLDRVAAV